MLRRFLDWVIYGDHSQEPSENIEFLKGLHSAKEWEELSNELVT